MKRSLVLDLDGTLVDTLGDIAEKMNGVLSARGLPAHAPDSYRHFVGRGVGELARSACPPDSPRDLVEELRCAMEAAYEADPVGSSHPYEGIAEALEALAAEGVALAVFTNKPETVARAAVSRLFPGLPFTEVIGDLPGQSRKPDPSRLIALLARLGSAPEAAGFAGDTDVDMLTARNARLPGIGCAWGFRGRLELESAGAALVIESPAELQAAFASLVPPARH
ncbi:MAG: HAD family hydrolase [Spirochaetales bacterium]|nr:HAD family hydrolase [Spirochaetales bacterium]